MKKKMLVNKLSGIFLLFISSFAFAGGITPFQDQTAVTQMPNSELVAPDTSNLVPFTSADISTLVASMRNTAQTCKATNNAIGLPSGLATRKDGIWTAKMIKNAEGLSGAVTIGNMKEYNVAWFPDDKKAGADLLNSVRFTTGRLKIGKMPPLGQAHLEIPIANIKKETIAGANNQNFIRYWFKAVVTGDDTNGYTTNLDPDLNYFEVLGTKAPILDFLGYYDDTGYWKIKIVINSDKQIIPSNENPIWPSIHPKLDLEIYSQGTALQSPYHDCANNPGQ